MMGTMEHRHLVLAYAFTWILQLSYAAYVLVKLLRSKPVE
jgi:hypothetical protein